jgi:hypothetical protein
VGCDVRRTIRHRCSLLPAIVGGSGTMIVTGATNVLADLELSMAFDIQGHTTRGPGAEAIGGFRVFKGARHAVTFRLMGIPRPGLRPEGRDRD